MAEIISHVVLKLQTGLNILKRPINKIYKLYM